MPSGIIIKGIGGFYYVKANGIIYECKARGVFRKNNMSPLPGDNVNITVTDINKEQGWIDEIHPRKSELVRPAVANVNQLAVVIAAKSPNPDFLLLDKLLVTAAKDEIDVVLCINKIDLDENQLYKNITSAYNKPGYKVIHLSSRYDIGYDDLFDLLNNRVTVFSGQSGVGKSTILNKLMNSHIMNTGEISEKINRGKHTTRHAELVEISSTGSYIVDTPGFSSFELNDNVESDALQFYYREFIEYIGTCRFTGCSHINEPGCGVKKALDEGKIDAGRYNRYIQLYNILKKNNKYSNKRNI